MTKITIQDGKPRIVSGKVSVNQQDCCCDLEMPTTLTLTLSETPEIYFRRRAGTEPTGPFGNDGLWLWPSSAAVLAKCGKSFTPMLDVLQTRGSVGEGPYVRALNDLTDFVPGGMPLQDQTIELTLVEQQPGQSYTYRGHAIRPPTNLTGPPPGQGLNDGCIDCGGTDGYNLTPLPANAGDTVLSFSDPIRPSGWVGGWLRVKGVEYRYGNATPGGYSLSLMTPLAESISGTDAVTILTELVTVTIQKRCVGLVPASVCISDPTKGDDRSRAAAMVTATDGVIDSIVLTSGGSGYASATTTFAMPDGEVQIVDQSGLGSGAKFSLTFQEFAPGGPDWFLASVSVTHSGSGYSGTVLATFVPLQGTYAFPNTPLPTLSVSVDDGHIDSVTVVFGGILRREEAVSVEADAPSVTFCAMKGDGAAATAVVDKNYESPTFGQITKLNLTSGGDGYNDTILITSEPTVTLTPQGGFGGALQVDDYFLRTGSDAGYYGISGVSVVHGGSGYADKTAVLIALGNGDTQRPGTLSPDIRIRTIRRPLDEWTLADKSSPNPSAGSGLGVSLTLVPFAVGDTRWKASGVSLGGRGNGYASGDTFDVSAAEGGTVSPARIAVTAVGVGGEVSEIALTNNGVFQGFDTGKIDRVEFFGDGWQGSYRNERIELKTVDIWSCTVDFGTGVSQSFSEGYRHASRLVDLANGYNCCAAVEQCRLDDDQRLAPCPKPLLSRVYDMVLPYEASNAVPDPLTGGVKFNYSWYHCGGSRGVGGIQNCDLGTINGCKEETLPTLFATPLTVVYSPLTGIKCKLTPGPAEDCGTAWLEPFCDGSCPGDSTLMASLVSLEITSDCQSASGATGTVTIGCIPELKDGVILSASVTNGGSGYAQIKLTEPTLSLSAPGGTGAVLTVTKYTPFGEWFRIDSIAVADGGSGYTDNSQVIITLGENDEAFPQQATPDIRIRTMRPPNDEWTMTQWMYIPWLETWEQIPMVGTGLVISLTLAPTYEGSPFYNASSVNVVAGGSGYSVGEFLGVDAVEQGTEGGESVYGAFLEITSVGPGGAVTGFGILEAGRFAGIDTGVIHSIEFGSWRGAYRKRVGQACNVTVAVTQQPPSNGSGAIITAVIQNDPTKNGFGTITGLTVVNGGENYVARCCGNPLP